MRTIKFRGQRVDTKEWVYGDLTIHHLQPYISKEIIEPPTLGDPGGSETYYCHEVVSETVGQFTGELDRNKKEVYDGDIFKIGAEKELFEVRFKHGCFLAFANNKQFGLLGEIANIYIEVIGNIHD